MVLLLWLHRRYIYQVTTNAASEAAVVPSTRATTFMWLILREPVVTTVAGTVEETRVVVPTTEARFELGSLRGVDEASREDLDDNRALLRVAPDVEL